MMKIKKYTNELYTIPVYVGYFTKESDIKSYKDKFTFLDFTDDYSFDGEELEKEIKSDIDCATAVTWRVQDKETGEIGALIQIVRKDEFDTGIMAHEAFHALQIMMTAIGLDFSRTSLNEHLAYLIGWITNCINDFVNGK